MKELEIRKKLKKKRPSFHREDSHKVKGIKKKWRRATGRHSKVRHQLRGYVKRIEPGYRSPAIIRGAHKSGLFPVIICNLESLNKIDKTKQGIVLSSALGKKKKVLILQKAKELGINVFNVKDISAYINKVQDFINKRKDKKAQIKKKKETKEKEKKKTTEKKAKIEEKLETEDKKKEEAKKELDKTLSQRKR